jgi:hypothetical protein
MSGWSSRVQGNLVTIVEEYVEYTPFYEAKLKHVNMYIFSGWKLHAFKDGDKDDNT